MARGAIALSQGIQKNECIDIRTQLNSKIPAIFALYKIQQPTPSHGLHPPHPLLHIYTWPLLKILLILFKMCFTWDLCTVQN